MKITPDFKRLLVRLGIFVLLFILLTGIIGSWIVGSGLLYRFSFVIYAVMAKMVMYGVIVFLLLVRKELDTIKIDRYRNQNSLYLILSILLIPIFFYFGSLLSHQRSLYSNPLLSVITHITLILCTLSILPGVFGFPFLGRFVRLYKKPLIITLMITLGFNYIVVKAWSLWPYLSEFILRIEQFLFSLSFPLVSITPPRILTVQKFSVEIAQACSGLDSLFLFSALYILIAIIDWKSFDKKKLIGMFFPVALGLLFINILRVYLLILIGVLINPTLALSLFHTYAGMVLFIVYFIIVMKFLYPKLLKK